LTKKARSTAKSTAAPSDELLTFAKAISKTGCNWVQANNAIYGPSGKFVELFTTPQERAAFTGSEADIEIEKILETLPEPPSRPLIRDASGKLQVRMPKSLHSALINEAAEEGVSLNQLIVSKLFVRLKAAMSN
jgi:hypothetical protein